MTANVWCVRRVMFLSWTLACSECVCPTNQTLVFLHGHLNDDLQQVVTSCPLQGVECSQQSFAPVDCKSKTRTYPSNSSVSQCEPGIPLNPYWHKKIYELGCLRGVPSFLIVIMKAQGYQWYHRRCQLNAILDWPAQLHIPRK